MSAGMFEGNHFVLNDGTGVFDLHDPEEETASWSTSQAGPVRGLTWTTTVGKTCMCAPDFRLTRRGRQFSDYPYVPDNFFHNEGGIFYEDSTGFFDVEALSFSAVTGDYNLDGFPDLVNNLVGEYAQVLEAIPNGNRWVKIRWKAPLATATASARRFAYTGTACSGHMTTCGENYLGQNSRWEHFGLGLASASTASRCIGLPVFSISTTTWNPIKALFLWKERPGRIRVRLELVPDARTQRRATLIAAPTRKTVPVTSHA